MNCTEILNQKENQVKEIDWEKLCNEIDFVSTKLLELFYSPTPAAYTLQEITKYMKKIQAKSSTVRNRVFEFDRMGLLKILPNTRPLCIHSVACHESNVKKLILIAYARFGIQSVNIKE